MPRHNDNSSYKCVYYEAMKQESKRRPIYECRCNERMKTKGEGSCVLYFEFVHYESIKGDLTFVYYESIKRELKIRPMRLSVR